MHNIAIPEYVIQRIIARRGKVSLFDTVVSRNTALLVIDMQNAFMMEGMPSYLPNACDLVPNVNKLAGTLRKHGGKVVWIKHTADEQWTVSDYFSSTEYLLAAKPALTPGHPGHALHNELQVNPTDLVVEKRRFSAFIQGSSDLDALLRKSGIDTVIITGVVSNSCCESTARDAMMLNYKTLFISDANGARTDEEHNATLANILRLFGDVLTTDELLARLS